MSKQQKLEKVAKTISSWDNKLTKFQATEIAEYLLVKAGWNCKNAMIEANSPYKLGTTCVWG